MFVKRLKKKDVPGKFYKSTTQSKSICNKEQLYIIRKRKKTNNIYYYWIFKENSDRLINERFQRQKLYLLTKYLIKINKKN